MAAAPVIYDQAFRDKIQYVREDAPVAKPVVCQLTNSLMGDPGLFSKPLAI